MFIELNNVLLCTDFLQRAFIDNNRIILQYCYNGQMITTELNYEDVKFDVNKEKQLIEEDYERLMKVLNHDFEREIEDLKEELRKFEEENNKLEIYKADYFALKYIIESKKNIFHKMKLLKGQINE